MDRPKQRSTEHYGVGQSGYTAGRPEPDPALERELEALNVAVLDDEEEDHPTEGGLDDRFTGRGRRIWAPLLPHPVSS